VTDAAAAALALGDLGAEAAASIIAVTTDISMIVDGAGVIKRLAVSNHNLRDDLLPSPEAWVGKPWVDTVTVESRPKIEALLAEADATAAQRWRQVNHPGRSGADVPVLYAAVRVAAEGPVLAFGRDLRIIASLQQRLVDAQQSSERDYSRLRHLETRYRVLFRMASDPVLIVDAASRKISEANAAAERLFDQGGKGLVGRLFPLSFDSQSTGAILALFAELRATGQARDVTVRMIGAEHPATISASLLRLENASLFLVRLALPAADGAAPAGDAPAASLQSFAESAPDGFVVARHDGTILTANATFLGLIQAVSEEQVRGQPLERWLGAPGIDFHVLITNLRQRGSVNLFPTTLQSEHGTSLAVEVSAVSVMNAGQQCFGFSIRNVEQRLRPKPPPDRDLPRSVNEMVELVGRVPLKDLVREAVDVIERLCIEAALRLTGDNRASAAEILGLSRQSLYVKLRRFGLADSETDRLEH